MCVCVYICVCVHIYLKFVHMFFLQIVCENSTKFTLQVSSGTKMDWLDFVVRRLNVKVEA